MADFDDLGSEDGGETQGGSASPGGSDGATPVINGGLLDPRTFPSRWAPLTDYPSVEPQAPEITGPLRTDVSAEVLQDILNAQAKLPPLPEDLSIDRSPPLVTGPLMTDPHAEVF